MAPLRDDSQFQELDVTQSNEGNVTDVKANLDLDTSSKKYTPSSSN